MSPPAVLEVDNLTFRYRRAAEPAIRNASLTLLAGEVLLVAGPSGCGKSTLIRAANGLIPHSYRGDYAGRVLVDGRSTAGMRLKDLAPLVGTVLQDPRKQLVASTVTAELAFGPENLGLGRGEIARRLAEVETQTAIEHLIGRTTDELSGGEGQQLAVAGALMMRPKLLVLDEPLANLDPASAHRLLRLVRELADGGTAVMIVEHRVEDVLDVRPDRVLYLDNGATRFFGALDAFLREADPTDVKVPFDISLDRARAAAPRPPTPSGSPSRGAGAAGAAARIEWRGVDAGYDRRVVLHGISASLGARQRVAVLGPNGSGKTTLFKSALGLLPTTAGTVLVDGEPVAGRNVADLATTFGYVFQNPSQMLFARTVREELLFGPLNLGRAPDTFDSIVRDTLRRVGLTGEDAIESRPPLTLSFGQQKRLAIGVALALQPRTLVLDEPSAGQDHHSATAFMHEVERIDGLESIYFVTHDADLALTHADRILLLRDGAVVADGEPLAVIADRARWEACNLRFTSLMEANAARSPGTGRFLGAEHLAAWITARERLEEGGRESAIG